MLAPFFAIGAAVTALCCALMELAWPRWIWAVPLMFVGFSLAVFLIFVLVLFVAGLLLDKKQPETRSRLCHRVVLIVVGTILALLRVKVTVEGEEKLPRDSRWLLVSNHRSGFDPIASLWALRRHELAFVAKPSIFKIPIAGPLIRRDLFLAIDRENNREALKTILKAAEYIKADETSFGIYPEGTRSRDQKLLPFRNGAFKIAQRANVPVVVATVENTEEIMHRFPLRSTQVRLSILHVFDAQTVAAEGTAGIGEQAFALMKAKLEPEG